MALPSLASRPSSVSSVVKQCCLAVQDFELLPTSVAVNSSLKVASFDTASQSHCPSTYNRDSIPYAAPQALASSVNTAPWCSGLNSGCAGFLSWVLCAAVTRIRGVFFCGERCISAGKLLISLLDVCWSESCYTKTCLYSGFVSNDLPLRTGRG